jgi:peptide/nickel transport system permease protein
VLMSAYEERPGAPRVLLSTLPNERHGLGLAMVEVYLAASQVTPIFLGVDTPPEQIVNPSWGNMLQTAQGYLAQTWTYGIFPGAAITLVVLGMNFFADSLQDALDPRRLRASR